MADYQPEMDQSKTLGPEQATCFSALIDILQWCIKLGWIDITMEVFLLSWLFTCRQEGYMQQAFHVFGYLKKHARYEMVLEFDQSCFWNVDWREFYPEAEEAIALDPQNRGAR
jgi:hypothetical protein